jgi:hypothetical protein
LPGLLISIVAVGLLLQIADWQEVLQAFKEMNLSGLIPAIILYILGICLRALTWQTLLQYKATYSRVFSTLNEGYLLNSVFPFRLGELGRVLILSQSAKLSAFFVFSTILIERAYDIAIAAGLLLATLPLVLGLENGSTIALTTLVMVISGLFALFFLANYREIIKVRIEKIASKNQMFRERFVSRLDSFLDGLGVLTRPSQFILSLLFMIGNWLFGLAEIHVLLNSGAGEYPLWWSGFALGVVSLGVALPSAPAGLGVYEAAMVGALTLLGYPPGQAAAVAIIAHLIHIVFTGLVGGIALFRDGETLAGLYKRLRNFTRPKLA